MTPRETIPVSVVIPAYNAARTIDATLASIRAQTAEPDEIVVVDDGSSDETSTIAERHGARVTRRPNGGLSRARNTGVEAARNDWIALIDADDTWTPDKLQRQWHALQRRPEVGFSFTDYVYGENLHGVFPTIPAYQDGNRQSLGECAFLWLRDDLLRAFCTVDFILPSTVMIRRDVYDAAGGFDPSVRFHEELEFFCRVLDHSDAIALECALGEYVRHDANMTKTNDALALMVEDLRIKDRMIAAPDRYPAVAVDTLRRWRPDLATAVGLAYVRRRQFKEGTMALRRSFAERPTVRSGLLVAAATAARLPGGLALLNAAIDARKAWRSRRT